MKSLSLGAALLALVAAPAVGQTRVTVSVRVAVPAVHGPVVVVAGRSRARHPRIVVVSGARHHHGARHGLVVVARPVQPRRFAHRHLRDRYHR